jgi:chaperone modulatory protein CbpM
MSQNQAEWIWLDTEETVTRTELCQCCGLSAEDLNELLDYCALQPVESSAEEPMFSAGWVEPLRAAGKLRVDFDLDMFTVAILLGNLNRIESLERQVRSLQARLPASMGLSPKQ